ncbi:GNAT family N-acetyltransferase [Rothia nasisuis]|uniref:GNAT family N-acetyltransferase n=1 Tax=Rothia nasisuis TaxID=2109647 RepID=UPI001F02DA98|nr:GNAT family N-acetyltransferase [Rothia nasisuis]
MFTVKSFYELTLDELNEIYLLRGLVFVVGQKITEENEIDRADRQALHFFHANERGEVLAYLRLFDLATFSDEAHPADPGAWTLGRVAVHPDARGTGLGRKLLNAALTWIYENTTAERVSISAQSYLKEGYYEKAGFKQVGEPYIEAGLEHVHMVCPLER